MITGPVVQTTTTVFTVDGGLVSSGNSVAIPETTRTQCLTDTFSVTNPGGTTPPTICGANTGDHSKCADIDYNVVISSTKTALIMVSFF